MADPQSVYGIAAGTDINLSFRAPKELYDGLIAQLGLTKFDTSAELSKCVFLPASQFLRRLSVVYKHTTGNRAGGVWCAPDKFEECLKGMTGNFRTFPIQYVNQPLDSARR